MLCNPTQAVADAYFVLSDPQRRSDYDKLSSSKSSSERTSDPNASGNFFRMFSGMFTNSAGNGPSGGVPGQPGQRPNADQVFGDAFEEVCHLFLSPFFTLRRLTLFLFFHYSFYDQSSSGVSLCGPG